MDKKEEKRLRIAQLREWLLEVMEVRQWTPYAWAKKAGLHPSYVQRAVIDEPMSELKAETVSLLARTAGVQTPRIDLSVEKLPVTQREAGDDEADNFDVELADADQDKVSVEQIDLRFGMGSGGMYDAPVESQPMSFSRAWIKQLTSAPVESLFWASGFGDSMYPTIADGDLVLVDSSQKTPRMFDQVWAINQYGHGMIKRLRPTNYGFLLTSDNPNVSTITATDGSMEVVGRVVAIVRKI
ncbi:S24 family peptidase [Asticcacaulis sp.]|uniref:S24 family peptidase n=1 Tax=Asticcacaulis sp. TaxID=1872648 RepID=UPI003F7C289A